MVLMVAFTGTCFHMIFFTWLRSDRCQTSTYLRDHLAENIVKHPSFECMLLLYIYIYFLHKAYREKINNRNGVEWKIDISINPFLNLCMSSLLFSWLYGGWLGLWDQRLLYS